MKLTKGLAAGLITAGIFFSHPAKALETDQYLTWNVELKDCSQAFNDYLNNKLIKSETQLSHSYIFQILLWICNLNLTN